MNIFRKFIREYNNFSKGDRHAILILALFAMISFFVAIVTKHVDLFPEEDKTAFYRELAITFDENQKSTISTNKSLFYFDPNIISKEELDSLNLPEFVKRNLLSYRNAGGKFKKAEDLRKLYGVNDSLYSEIKEYIRIYLSDNPKAADEQVSMRNFDYFDPNMGNSEELVNSGLSRFQAENIINYRNKGGVFRKSTDLLKIYGIDSVTFKQIEKYVKIEVQEPERKTEEFSLIELNSADTTDLLKLDGIGPVYARRIIKYRDLLGGFSHKTQLLEIYNFPPETFQKIETSIYTDTLSLRKVRINFSEYKDFIRHPYFRKQQVEAILKYRQKNGPFKNVEELRKENLLDEQTFSKIKPYLTCQ